MNWSLILHSGAVIRWVGGFCFLFNFISIIFYLRLRMCIHSSRRIWDQGNQMVMMDGPPFFLSFLFPLFFYLFYFCFEASFTRLWLSVRSFHSSDSGLKTVLVPGVNEKIPPQKTLNMKMSTVLCFPSPPFFSLFLSVGEAGGSWNFVFDYQRAVVFF